MPQGAPPTVATGSYLVDPHTPVPVATAGHHAGMGRWRFPFPEQSLTVRLSPATERLARSGGLTAFTTTLAWRVSAGP
ncbi:MAG: hypothetical protein K6T68_13745 [Alicyclobacillus shizuokensis]|nr:hypothetical protein [Alicyclobacillus shizuokensis]